MKILIAVVNCHKRLAYQQAIRNTWLPLVSGADVRFFLGPANREPKADEVFLYCDDSYQGLPPKFAASCVGRMSTALTTFSNVTMM